MFSQNSVSDEIQFSQKSLINRKKPTTYPSTASPGATNHNNILLLLQAPEVRNCRSGGTGKRLKF